ncbi:MAG: hypothetical protein HZB39_04745 [Planctomycetes bacterium]|nr:hypothetical protein [Planctomycetota bacterium]
MSTALAVGQHRSLPLCSLRFPLGSTEYHGSVRAAPGLGLRVLLFDSARVVERQILTVEMDGTVIDLTAARGRPQILVARLVGASTRLSRVSFRLANGRIETQMSEDSALFGSRLAQVRWWADQNLLFLRLRSPGALLVTGWDGTVPLPGESVFQFVTDEQRVPPLALDGRISLVLDPIGLDIRIRLDDARSWLVSRDALGGWAVSDRMEEEQPRVLFTDRLPSTGGVAWYLAGEPSDVRSEPTVV